MHVDVEPRLDLHVGLNQGRNAIVFKMRLGCERICPLLGGRQLLIWVDSQPLEYSAFGGQTRALSD